MTAKQQLFVKEYLVDLNGTQAAIRAGYSENSAQAIATENLSKPLISEAIQSGMDKRSEKTKINAEYVLKKIQSALESAEKSDDLPNVYRGAELLGKHLKLFSDRVEIEQQLTITNLLDNLPDIEGN